MLPVNSAKPLERHLQKVKAQHEEDLEAGFSNVYLPSAIEHKYRARQKNGRGNTCSLLLVYQRTRVLRQARGDDTISMKAFCRTR
jgi:hypothetical protein